MIDGVICDFVEICDNKFLVFVRGVIFKLGVKKCIVLLNELIICVGVMVYVGDIIVVDEEGIVVILRDEVLVVYDIV